MAGRAGHRLLTVSLMDVTIGINKTESARTPLNCKKEPTVIAGRGHFSTNNINMKKLHLYLLLSFTAVISRVQWTKVSEVVRTAISLGHFMIYIPAHLGILPI